MWRRGGVLVGVVCSSVVFVGVAGASPGSLVRAHRALQWSRSQMTLARAPAGLRAAARRTLAPPATSSGISQHELTASDGTGADDFGWSVAISGATAVVGAPFRNDGEGAVYVFVRSGSTWTQQAELTPPDGFGGDRFGISVAISGSTLLVGSPYSTATGVAYVFVRSGSTWSEQAELTSSDGGLFDAFGSSVALSGSTAVIGALYHSDDAGAAYVFVQSGTSWTQDAELTASDGVSGDDFGASVAVSSSPVTPTRWTVVAGAPSHNSFTGAAYVFAGTGMHWAQQAELTASDAAKGKQFGVSVAVSGPTAVVGDYTGGAGAAYVFVRSGTSWTQQAELTDGEVGDGFGFSVAIDHNTALIGAPTGAPTGETYVFGRSGSTWSESDQLTGSDPSDTGGSAVAIDNAQALIGAPSASGNGAAYVFKHI